MKQFYMFNSAATVHKTNSESTNGLKMSAIRPKLRIIFGLILGLFVFSAMEVAGQTYYSLNGLPANTLTSWNTLPGGGGSNPLTFDGTSTWIIQNGHSMPMSGTWVVGTGGSATVTIDGGLTVTSTFQVSVTGTLTVNGTLTNSGSFSGSSPVTASGGININGTYIHARNGGTLPTAVWSTSSNCNMTGITDIEPVIPSATQPLGNFSWDCSSQLNTTIDLKGDLTSVNGNFNISNTGLGATTIGGSISSDLTVGSFTQTGGIFYLAGGFGYTRKMTVTGSFVASGGTFYINPSRGTGTLDVGGNFSSSGSFNFTYLTGSTMTVATLNITGNCSITGGTFDMSGSNANGIMNLYGNFSHTGGTITESTTYAGTGSIIFKGSSQQTYTSGGTITNVINITVNSGSYLQMASSGTVVSGGGTFTLPGGGKLGITSADGITTAGTSAGNIQTTVRTYSGGADYIYNGTLAQVTGTGLTQNTPRDLTIANSLGVSQSSTTTISGLLTISSGTLNMANTNLNAGSLTGSGNISNSSGALSDITLTVGSDNTSPAAYSGAISNGAANSLGVSKTGTGTLILSGTNTYSGATTITTGILQLGSGTGIGDGSKVVMNGGTLSTGATTGYSETAGVLSIQSNSTIALGTGIHTLAFSASNGESWGGGATLTITGWSGTIGQSGSAGKIFVGSDAMSLTAGQLAKINFDGYSPEAAILSNGEVVPIPDPAIALSSSNPAVAAGNMVQNTTNNIIYKFTTAVTLNDALMTGLQITTSGTYVAGDLTDLKAWYSADNSFEPGTDILLSTKSTSLGAGIQVFPGWTNQFMTRGTLGYFFITADIPCSATAGSTINISAVTTSDLTFVKGTKSGTAFPGGVQTIVDATPGDVTGTFATIADTRSVLTWVNPAGCFDEVMIVAKSGSAVTTSPTGSGSLYTGNLVFGTGTGFDGGFVVYKGMVSPQTVTSLTNGETYYYTFFGHKGTTWSSGVTVSAKAAADGERVYRSAATGLWGSLSTWEMSYDGSTWVPATAAPDNTYGQITILSGHNVTVASPVSVDQVVVASGGQVTVAAGITLTIADGAAVNDFTVNGTLSNAGTITSTGKLVFTDGSSYIHAQNGGTIPVATWSSAANCNITGITGTVPTIPPATQPFGNFTWSCASQSGSIDLAGTLSTINGSFNIANTNSNILFQGATTPSVLTAASFSQTGGIFGVSGQVGISGTMTTTGNFSVSGGTFYINPSRGAGILNVGGNFSSSGSFNFTFLTASTMTTATLNITGNCSITGGTFDMSGSNANGIMNLYGNFSHTGGTITESTTYAGIGSIIFKGASGQTYTSGGAITNVINITVNSGSYLQMASSGTVVSGGGTFTLSGGAKLGITSADGITTAGTAAGNIQTTVRTYSGGADYIYNGTVAQVTGTGLTQNTPRDLTIANSLGVSQSSGTIISGLLSVNNGTFDMANNNLNVGSLTGSANISNSTGVATNVTLTIGSDNTSPAAYSGAISNGTANSLGVSKTGTGTLILSGTNTYSGATTITTGILQLGSGTGIGDGSKVVMNGGTLSTGATTGYSETAGVLSIQSNSTIALGTGIHTLAFSASNGESWGGGATLSITGWSGTIGQSGSAGKIFVGSDAMSLTAGQLAKINFDGYSPEAAILSDGEVVPIPDPAIALSSSDPAVDAGSVNQSTQDHIIYKFITAVTLNDALMTGLQIATSGSYAAADLTNLKAWYSPDNSLEPGTDILLSTKTTSLGAGTQVFPGWTNQFITRGTLGYIFITADIPCSAIVGNQISVAAVTTSDITFQKGTKSGTTAMGGVQTIADGVPGNVTVPNASIANTLSVLTWTNPGCLDDIMIVAKANTAVTASPSGNGSLYTGNLVFGSGTGFDGGFVVYKGTVSPETVTNLTNGVTYYYTFFSRRGTTWSSGVTVSAKAAADGERAYRSAGTGLWGNVSTWEMSYDGSTWVPATAAPDNTYGPVTILGGHIVTVASLVSVDQVVVASGGQVTVSSGITLTIADGADINDISVNGTLSNAGTVTSTGKLVFTDGSSYIHARDGGTIPVATWTSGANCNITGITSTVPTIPPATQPFGNFTWSCASQSGNIDLAGSLTTINGAFNMSNTNNKFLFLGGTVSGNITSGSFSQTGGVFGMAGSTGISRTMTVTGNFNITGGSFYINPSLAAGTLNVGANFSSSGSFYFTYPSGSVFSDATLNITGNCSITGSSFYMSETNANGIMNLYGNFSHTGGTITESTTYAGIGSIIFKGASGQTYTSGGAITNVINITVNSGSYLQMASPGTVVSGGGTFTLSGGGMLGITSADGITTAGTAAGNIQTTGRTFSTGANYVYNGTGAQNTGSGLPSTINSLYIVGPSNLTLTSASPLISGTIQIETGGNLNIGASQEVTTSGFVNDGTMIIESSAVDNNGSFIATGSITQTGTVTFKRQLRPKTNFGDYHLYSSPVGNNSIANFKSANNLKISKIKSWDDVNAIWADITNSGGNLVSGKGYSLGQTAPSVDNDSKFSFTGSLVNSTSVTATSPYLSGYTDRSSGYAYGIGNPDPIWTSGRSWTNYGSGGWNLLGNPFTSSMNAETFVTSNIGSFDPNYRAVYIYDGPNSQYKYAAAVAPGWPSGINQFGSTIQAGQGFFVLALYDNISFGFDQSMQVHNTTISMTKSANIEVPWPGLQLKAKKGSTESMTTIVYNRKMSAGLDPGYDVGLFSSGTDVEIFTSLAVGNNGVNFTRQALPMDDCRKYVVPIGINSAKGGEVTFSAFVIPLDNYRFYLEDRSAGVFTNLNTDKYTVTLPEKTYGTGRFFLYASVTTPKTSEKPSGNLNELDLRIWRSQDQVKIEGAVSDKAVAALYDLQGHKIFETRLAEGSYNTFAIPSSIVKGVYIVKVTDGLKICIKRVVVV